MLNLAGREYDFGPVLFTVLGDCEHRRRSLPAGDAEAAAKLAVIARQKLDEIKLCYEEAGGTAGYWRELESEVLETALPQYARAAAAKTRLELASYGLWRQGDPLSRLVLGLAGLTVGGLIVKAPFIPIFEDAFAFVLAAAAFFYPEIKRLAYDWRYSRLLNRLIAQAEGFQHRQLPYLSEAGLEAELDAVGSAAGGVPSATADVPSPAAGVPAAAAGAPAAAQAQPAGARRTNLVPAPTSIFAPSETAAAPSDDAPRPRAAEPTELTPTGPRPNAAERH
jgi:hypothetical protein